MTRASRPARSSRAGGAANTSCRCRRRAISLGACYEHGKRRPNDIVNDIRNRVAIWRRNGHPGATPITRRLLDHWTAKDRTRRLFFCRIEAAATAIWLTEAAPRTDTGRLRAFNPELIHSGLPMRLPARDASASARRRAPRINLCSPADPGTTPHPPALLSP